MTLLGGKEPLQWKLTDEGLWIGRPDIRPCDGASVFKIEMRGVAVEKLSARRLDAKRMRDDLRVHNLGAEPAKQEIDILDNGRKIGRQAFELQAGEAVPRELVLAAPQRSAVETITAAIPGGKPFAVHEELVSPPNYAAARTFDGSTKLAVAGLGKHDRLTIALWVARENEGAVRRTVEYQRLGTRRIARAVRGQRPIGRRAARPGIPNNRAFHLGSRENRRLADDRRHDRHGRAAGRNLSSTASRMARWRWPTAARSTWMPLPWAAGTASRGRWWAKWPTCGSTAASSLPPKFRPAARAGDKDGLLAAWNFVNGDGNVIPDASGHGHHRSVVK